MLLTPLWLFLYSYSLFFQTLGSLVWPGHKHVLFGWQGRSPRSIHRALWQGTIHNWGLKIYVRTIYLNYFVIFVNSHYLVNNRLEVRKISQKITEAYYIPCSNFFLTIENIHRALWQGTIHNWGLKIYVRTIYLNYFVIFVNSHYLDNYRLYHRSKLSCSHFFLRIENICIILLWDFLTFIHYCDQIGCFKSTLSLMPFNQIYECFITLYYWKLNLWNVSVQI